MKINPLKLRAATLKVLIVTLCLTILIFIGSYFYYDGINSAEDPRVLQAKIFLNEYEKKLEENETGLSLTLLKSMYKIYKSTPSYEKSYEVGVVFNNMASVHLVKVETMLLTQEDEDKIDTQAMDEDLKEAQVNLYKAIDIYESWMDRMGTLSHGQILEKIKPFFQADDPAFKDVDAQKILEKRIDEILTAQIETPRRLSVVYTNLGVVNRYKGNLETSKKNYEKALSLWERNYIAKDNLDILMNRPVKKRSIITRLFPPDRKKES